MAAFFALAHTGQAAAQGTPRGTVTVGSRAQPRAAAELPVPVDVIPVREIVRPGDTDLANLLRNVVPSFNVNIQPISDGATFVRPANLRGLAPDHTLVLINGKRRHRTAALAWYGNGLADGSQGPDIALIPGIALEQAEVLRDGASAQYGSDAIAGVMNFVLKDDRSGGSIEVKTGGYPFAEHQRTLLRRLVPGGRRDVHPVRERGPAARRDRLPEPDRRVRQRRAPPIGARSAATPWRCGTPATRACGRRRRSGAPRRCPTISSCG